MNAVFQDEGHGQATITRNASWLTLGFVDPDEGLAYIFGLRLERTADNRRRLQRIVDKYNAAPVGELRLRIFEVEDGQ